MWPPPLPPLRLVAAPRPRARRSEQSPAHSTLPCLPAGPRPAGAPAFPVAGEAAQRGGPAPGPQPRPPGAVSPFAALGIGGRAAGWRLPARPPLTAGGWRVACWWCGSGGGAPHERSCIRRTPPAWSPPPRIERAGGPWEDPEPPEITRQAAPGVPRAHLAAAAQRLRGEGLSYPAIARELHVALSTAHRLVTGG